MTRSLCLGLSIVVWSLCSAAHATPVTSSSDTTALEFVANATPPPAPSSAPNDKPALAPSDKPSPVPVPKGSSADHFVEDVFSGRWLDPKEPYWRPRSGERWEVSAALGGEAAVQKLAANQIPTVGGVVLTLVGRYYPVDNIAVIFGGRAYFGLDGVPAAGTTASSVISPIVGFRYGLVRENRFSLAWDFYSGPSAYVFASLAQGPTPAGTVALPQLAIGGEMGTGLALRYSIGPITGELRGVVGGRAGASSTPFQRAFDAGPFSALYAGVDVGGTWSL